MWKVYAESKEKKSDVNKQDDKKPENLTKKSTVRACELPVYGEPAYHLELVKQTPNAYEKLISDARRAAFGYMGVPGSTGRVQETIEEGKVKVKEGLRYLQKDGGVLPKAVFISTAGLVGIAAAYRGGIIRKGLYSGILMGGAAAVCFPEEAADISKREWTVVRNVAIHAYRDFVNPGSSWDKLTKSSFKSEDSALTVNVANKPPSDNKQPSPVIKTVDNKSPTGQTQTKSTVRTDPGMSNPADADMYTTRSSK